MSEAKEREPAVRLRQEGPTLEERRRQEEERIIRGEQREISTEEARVRAEEARARAEQREISTEESRVRAEEARARAEEARARVEGVGRSVEEIERDLLERGFTELLLAPGLPRMFGEDEKQIDDLLERSEDLVEEQFIEVVTDELTGRQTFIPRTRLIPREFVRTLEENLELKRAGPLERGLSEEETEFLPGIAIDQERLERVRGEEKRGEMLLFEESIRPSASFETPTFNATIIENIIIENLDAKGDVLDQESLKNELTEPIIDALREALVSANPSESVRGILQTVNTGLFLILDRIKDDSAVSRIVDDIIGNAINVEGLEQIFPIAKPLEPELLQSIFSSELDHITTSNISIANINNIARIFTSNIERLGLDRDKLADVRNWIDEHVINAPLKNKLLNDLNIIDSQLATLLIRDPVKMVRILPSGAQAVDTPIGVRQTLAVELEKDLREIADADAKTRPDVIFRTVERVNEILDSQKLTTIRRGREVPLLISQTIKPLSKLSALKRIAKDLVSPAVRFRYIPIIAEGRPVDIQSVIDQITSAPISQPRAKERKRRERRRNIKRVPHHNLENNFGNITVFHMEGINKFEILIPPNAVLEDIMKIAKALSMENGLLENVEEEVILQIKKRETSVSEIIEVFMMEQRINLGAEFRLLYIPDNKLVGGAFLAGGGLDMILKRRPLVKRPILASGIPRKHKKSELLNIPFSMLYKPSNSLLV